MQRFLARQPIFNAARVVYGIRDFATMLPKDRVVLEILETVPMDDEVHDACRRLKQAGYLLALDDFQDRPDWKPLVAMADFIKVDLLATSPADQLRLAQTYLPMKIRLVAEKVDTNNNIHRTLRWGYAFFRAIFSAGQKCSRATTFRRTR